MEENGESETFPGRDGRVRTVKIANKKGMINRPDQKLLLLEEFRNSIQNETEDFSCRCC